MSIYYNSYCPHCGHTLNRDMGISSKYSGSPIRSCPKCSKIYCDPRYFEPALEPYKRYSLLRQFFGALPLAFAITVFVLFLVYSITRSDHIAWILGAVSLGISWLLFFFYSIKKRRIIEEKRLKEWQESDQRLRDPNYAALLKSARFDVPSRYLPENFIPDPNSVPQKPKEKAYLASG